jgi:hypothetical protein
MSAPKPVPIPKLAGPRRKCPMCGRTFSETMPVGSGATLTWVPRPVCTRHAVNPRTGQPS